MHPIHDNEEIRDEALRQLLGVWDHIKNRCTESDIRERAKNYALEFVGFWPYKRESRRVIGDYVLTEEDIRAPSARPDDIAYGSWGVDIHIPGGIEPDEPLPIQSHGATPTSRNAEPFPTEFLYARATQRTFIIC